MNDGVEIFPWHADAWQRLAAARAAGRLPHALLLSGPPGLGKSAFAARLGNALVCPQPDPSGNPCGTCHACQLARAGSHPDQLRVAPEEPGKMIRIDAVRRLSDKNVLAAEQGGYRVFVIDPADALNRAAANALLKTLEEPASRSVLVLVTSHPDRLMPTIRSRCQVVKFPLPDRATVRAWLARQVADEDLDALIALGGGAPLRALQARDEGWPELGRKLLDELQALRERRVNPLQTLEDWQKRSLTQTLDAFKRCLADLVRLAGGAAGPRLYHPDLVAQLQSLGQDLDLRKLFRFNDELLRLGRESSNNLNEQMLLEHLASRWLEITRPGGRR